ncbi:hypothetical protein [Flavobacterium gilvum]|uniref:Uncharacterized protein n=1 Tax=Flavobacterium gilvum TaxID=1492737 RepID=A0AAC9I5C2_9FLAO|nr:hypothetical protein [Flavobacterium gilvum]AOW09681.1 hypothetical protein EM308_09280 [Flavobacterium gilvum]KFC60788.1 hypothetical protein FEM08_04300 [Flavobacterium gilvum]
MKELIIKVFLIVILLISPLSFAQGLNKISLLNELNKTYGIVLNEEEKSYFESTNNELVTNLFSLDEKKLSKEERDKAVDKLFDKREKSLTSSLGINKYSDLKITTDEKIKQTIQKVKSSKMEP